jgi:TPR repeat protein
MDNFTVGDRCLVHQLESEAGQPLNGQYVTLADAIIEKGKCKFDDGSFANIKPCNLQILSGDRVSQTTEKCEENASSNLNKTEDQIKKEITTDDDKKETAAPPPPPPTTTKHSSKKKKKTQQQEKKEECSICLDVLPIRASKVARASCCGKAMHIKCREDMIKSKMSQEQKERCVMCRTRYPDDTKEGKKESVKRLRRWVKRGKAWAQFMLGCRYRDGKGVKKDEKRAVVLFNLAADQDDVQAQFNLGCMYVNGHGVDQSFTKAKEWFTLAASQGNEPGITALKALDEVEGRTTTPSSTVNSNTIFCSYCNKPEPTNTKFNRCQRCRSVFYCNRECQLKHWTAKPNGHKKQCKKLKALYKLKKEEDQMKKKVTTDDDDKKETAPLPTPPTTTQQQEEEECSICLDVLPKSHSKSVRATCCGKSMHTKCRKDIVSSKMSQEQKNRCVMCRTKYPADTKEGNKVHFERLRKWAKRGKAWAQFTLGCRYKDGKGVKKDLKRAVVLYNLASEQGYAVAQHNLGCMYRDGQGVNKDDKRAFEFYTLAADQGYAHAQFDLGIVYEHGQEGVNKDEKRAVELFTLAADQGHARAQCSLGCIYAIGQCVEKSYTKAREWISKAAAQGDENAINALKALDELDEIEKKYT